LEAQLVDEVSGADGAELSGTLAIGASTGPGGAVVPRLLGDFQRRNPKLSVALSVFDTHHVVELVAERALELGVVGAASKHRAVEFEPLFRDEVILAC